MPKCKQKCLGRAAEQKSLVDIERLQNLEHFLFPDGLVHTYFPRVLWGLRHVLRLETISEIKNVGIELHEML